MMTCYSATCEIRRHKNYSKKHTKAFACVHQPGPKLQDQIRRLQYWPEMFKDAVAYAERDKVSNPCWLHTTSPELLLPIVASWSFKAWRIDVIGPISPLLLKRYQFILAIIDYFPNGRKPYNSWKSKLQAYLTSSDIMSSPKRVIHNNCPRFVS